MRHLLYILFLTSLTLGATEVELPHLTTSDTWRSQVQVDNLTEYDTSYFMEIYAEGKVIFSRNYSIGSFGENSHDLSTLAPGGVCGKITYLGTGLKIRLGYKSQVGGGLAEFLLNDVKSSDLAFLFSDDEAIAWKGMAVTNLQSTDAQVVIAAMGDGQILDQTTLDVAARDRVVGLHSDWFPGVDLSDVKKIVIHSSGPDLSGIAISGNATSAQLLFTQAQPIAPIPEIAGSDNMSGTWSGAWASTKDYGYTGGIVANITRNGNRFVAPMAVESMDCGDFTTTFNGTIQRLTYEFSGDFTCQEEVATLQFTEGDRIGNRIEGKYSIKLRGFTFDYGTFHLTRRVE